MMRELRRMSGAVFGLALGLSLSLSPAAAQNATYLSDDASYCDIFRSISKVVPGECAGPNDRLAAPAPSGIGLTRSIVRRDVGAAPEPSVAIQQNTPERMAIAMKVQFGFDSAVLTPEAQATLDRLAEVFKNELLAKTYLEIDGHADATGSADYNLDLSARRAQAVRAYLVETRGVDPNRLLAKGKGESEPYDPDNPYGAINRRVEFVNISG